jgi:hypothetical protein
MMGRMVGWVRALSLASAHGAEREASVRTSRPVSTHTRRTAIGGCFSVS